MIIYKKNFGLIFIYCPYQNKGHYVYIFYMILFPVNTYAICIHLYEINLYI